MNESIYEQVQVFTEYSAWYILLCLLAGALYAFSLYQKKAPWSEGWNKTLAVGRFVLVSLICVLLLGIFIKQTKSQAEPPTWIFAIDDSQSMRLVNDTTTLQQTLGQVDSLAEILKEKNYNVHRYSLSQTDPLARFQNMPFEGKATNLTSTLHHIQRQYENLNVAGVVLVSDGIYNQGIAPNYSPYNFKLHTVGVGDTLAQTDLSIKTVFSNKIAYLGNQFPIVAEVSNTGFVGKKAKLSLLQGSKVLETQEISFTKDNSLQQVRFLTSSEKKGVQHYRLRLQPQANEFTTANNTKDVYIDIIDSREKILLVAASPHPDIKAIRSVIENNDNYEFDLFIPTISKSKPTDKYDLVILHQLPDLQGRHRGILSDLVGKANAFLYIVGKQTNLNAFNQLNTGVQIKASGRQTDKVIPLFNGTFDKFTFESEQKSTFEDYPPATVPFGNFDVNGSAETILYQRVGNVRTKKPLLVVGEQNDKKIGVLLGEGIWQWRLHEYAQIEKQEAFDMLFGKLIQYLSAKEDKRKFRVYPTSTEYDDSETVQFEVEIYNDIYEKIAGQDINLQLTNEEGESTSYSFVNNSTNFRYQINGLPQGIYRYKATTVLNGKTEVSTGQFTIRALQIEAINTTANFNLLRQLAKQNKGSFFQLADFQSLSNDISSKEPINILHAYEEFAEVVEQSWLLFVLVLLASLEWFVRKFKGGY